MGDKTTLQVHSGVKLSKLMPETEVKGEALRLAKVFKECEELIKSNSQPEGGKVDGYTCPSKEAMGKVCRNGKVLSRSTRMPVSTCFWPCG